MFPTHRHTHTRTLLSTAKQKLLLVTFVNGKCSVSVCTVVYVAMKKNVISFSFV